MEIISNVIDTVADRPRTHFVACGIADTQLHHIAIAVVTNRRFAAIFYSLHRQAKIRMPVSHDLAFDKVDRKKPGTSGNTGVPVFCHFVCFRAFKLFLD